MHIHKGLLKTAGKGDLAVVKLVQHILTGKATAMKIIDETQHKSSSLQSPSRQAGIMEAWIMPTE
ncbi:hypothetical protein GH733_006899 [Mirounga leonina]|nr:hypothetical protein GH733_006899 [Mirounga leonina]